MAKENVTIVSHLSVAMTTTEADGVPGGGTNTVPSSSSRRDLLYFPCAVIFIGVVGAAANALILYAMIASKQHKKQLLIFNQNAFDLCSCLLLVAIYTLKLCNIRLTGTLGYWLCMMLLSENLLWCSINGSVVNLLSITVERYLKVVHPSLSKKILRRRVKFSAAAFAWIGSTAYSMAVVFSTSAVVDGVCYGYVIWNSRVAADAYGIWKFVSFFVLVLFIFVFCYGRILIVIRRQARVMASHCGTGSSTAQTQSHHIQSNVIKTMVLVSAFYVATWTPDNVYYLMLNVESNFTLLESEYYVMVFVAFLYICANPFIYATKFDPVKRVLASMIPCKKSQPAADGGIEINARANCNNHCVQ